MKTFTRVFLIVFTYTITTKIDKDLTPQQVVVTTTGSNSTVVVLDVTPWPTVFWPFWIYVSLFLILSLTSIILFAISFLKYCSILISNGEDDIEAIREHHLNGPKRRSARQLLF